MINHKHYVYKHIVDIQLMTHVVYTNVSVHMHVIMNEVFNIQSVRQSNFECQLQSNWFS